MFTQNSVDKDFDKLQLARSNTNICSYKTGAESKKHKHKIGRLRFQQGFKLKMLH